MLYKFLYSLKEREQRQKAKLKRIIIRYQEKLVQKAFSDWKNQTLVSKIEYLMERLQHENEQKEEVEIQSLELKIQNKEMIEKVLFVFIFLPLFVIIS